MEPLAFSTENPFAEKSQYHEPKSNYGIRYFYLILQSSCIFVNFLYFENKPF